MRNALIWSTVFVVLLFIAGKTPKSEQTWMIVETGALLYWCAFGAILFTRGLWRFISAAPRGH